jgi:hypothetical protein
MSRHFMSAPATAVAAVEQAKNKSAQYVFEIACLLPIIANIYISVRFKDPLLSRARGWNSSDILAATTAIPVVVYRSCLPAS